MEGSFSQVESQPETFVLVFTAIGFESVVVYIDFFDFFIESIRKPGGIETAAPILKVDLQTLSIGGKMKIYGKIVVSLAVSPK